MRILLVEDHPLMAEALRLALGSLGGDVVVEAASRLAAALETVERHGETDMVLLDLGLPDSTGTEGLRRFRERFPALPVVVISASNEPSAILAALDQGAMGFIPKTSPKEVLLGAVRLVASGGIYVPVEALHAADARGGSPAPIPAAAGTAGAAGTASTAQLGLSPRQAEVLELLLKGLPNKLIARKLDISENTTKIHVSAVLRALGVSTRTQALIAVSRLGLRLERQKSE